MADNRHRDTPPGEDGIESRGQKPRAKEIINFLGLICALFRREDAGDTGKVNATKSDCQDTCPAHSCKCQVAQHISQRELCCTEVEDLECKQGTDDHHAPGRASIEATSAKQITEQRSKSIPGISTVCSHHDLLCRIKDNSVDYRTLVLNRQGLGPNFV